MKVNVQKISFVNKILAGPEFEILTLKELYAKKIDHQLTNPQQIGFYLLMLITSGKDFHYVDFNKHTFTRGTVFTIGKNQIQKFSGNKKSDALIILFTENFIIKYFEKKETFQRLLLFNNALLQPYFQLSKKGFADIFEVICSLKKEYFDNNNDQYKEGILRSGLHTLLLKLERYKQQTASKPNTKAYLQEFFAFKYLLEKHLFETRNVNSYAGKLGFSAKKLNYITQTIVNKPAKDFINETFILEIKRLLIGNSQSIKEIAYTCGFDEPTNFVKYFKKYTGHLPTKFRKASI